ncbi:endonuclease/exonuclease/phosphatase family protein [Clostridium sp. 'White wine YQ']|uniref:endonuclease/exonuclease/phosphatase family protein n=1 Tax=Clostridium sp. 'White wine YQ' TaxID=3027474 RepID=UPI0023650560|nr:endonuclease/exonuclease/phosphatase family protein [Clostridium sp. 'White wine YQ']MDD7794343.1 endonuclease/exonuclease/phosphatase family protein [Clostridium sp. 'White wine YQ']
MLPLDKIGLTVMTWNIYQGEDVTPIFMATPQQIPERVTEAYRQFLATNFPERAKAIASQIALKKPDLIGLQEAVIVELIPPNAKKVVFNFIDILLYELAKKGVRYRVAAQNFNANVVLPASTGNLVRLIDRDAILIRRDSDVEVISKQEANFTTNLQVQIGGKTVTLLQGWSYINACIKGKKFRLINTHLQPLDLQVQVAQANELLAGPANTNLPLILLGDFNSNAYVGLTYNNLIAAGLSDTWVVGGVGNGFTAHQDSDVLNALSTLSERIDLILVKKNINWNVLKDELVGEAQEDRTFTRLWPSDHASVVSRLDLKC